MEDTLQFNDFFSIYSGEIKKLNPKCTVSCERIAEQRSNYISTYLRLPGEEISTKIVFLDSKRLKLKDATKTAKMTDAIFQRYIEENPDCMGEKSCEICHKTVMKTEGCGYKNAIVEYGGGESQLYVFCSKEHQDIWNKNNPETVKTIKPEGEKNG